MGEQRRTSNMAMCDGSRLNEPPTVPSEKGNTRSGVAVGTSIHARLPSYDRADLSSTSLAGPPPRQLGRCVDTPNSSVDGWEASRDVSTGKAMFQRHISAEDSAGITGNMDTVGSSMVSGSTSRERAASKTGKRLRKFGSSVLGRAVSASVVSQQLSAALASASAGANDAGDNDDDDDSDSAGYTEDDDDDDDGDGGAKLLMRRWLQSLDLDALYDCIVEENGYTSVKNLVDDEGLDHEVLKDMGLKQRGARVRLLAAIAAAREKGVVQHQQADEDEF